MRRRAVVITSLLGLAAVTAVAVLAVNTPRSTPMVGELAPALAGPGLHAEQVDLDDMRGDIVLVNMWASWCQPCADEVPVLVEAAGAFGDSGVRVIGVNTQDQTASALRAAERWGADAYPNIVDGDGRIAVSWGLVGLPETYVIDRDGTILERHFGPVTMDWLNQTLDTLVAR